MAEILQYAQRKVSLFDPLLASEDKIIERLLAVAKPVLEYFKAAGDQAIADRFARKFGEGGVREYFFGLCELVYATFPDFGSSEFHEHLKKTLDQRRIGTNQAIIDLETVVRDHVINVLKAVHGTKEMKSGEKAYWELGIESPKAREDAYKAQQGDPVDKRLPKEAYLHLLDLMKIVRQRNNWPHFERVFNIQMPSEKGKAYYLTWMERLNELRRIPAHSSSIRVYEEEDHQFVGWLKDELYGRLENENLQ